MTISNGKGYYYKEVDGVEQLVTGAAASQTYGGNIDLFNYAQLNMYGGTVTGGEAYRGGNINVGHGALTTKPIANIMGGEITNGTSVTTFSPDDECTRAQIVTFLWRFLSKRK